MCGIIQQSRGLSSQEPYGLAGYAVPLSIVTQSQEQGVSSCDQQVQKQSTIPADPVKINIQYSHLPEHHGGKSIDKNRNVQTIIANQKT